MTTTNSKTEHQASLFKVLSAQRHTCPEWLKQGARLRHETYGIGTVLLVLGTFLQVRFESHGVIDLDWVNVLTSLKPQTATRLEAVQLSILPPLHQALLEHLKPSLTYVNWEPPREGRFEPIPEALPAAVQTALRQAGIGQVYSHQAEAVKQLLAGLDVCQATVTGSGKSLTVVMLAFRNALKSQATTIILSPTKALVDGLLADLLKYNEQLPKPLKIVKLTGDVPLEERQGLMSPAPAILVTNPESLNFQLYRTRHRTYAAGFRTFLSRLQLVVIDEGQEFTGSLGSHTVNLLRRTRIAIRRAGGNLDRLQYIINSATVRNPAGLSALLTQREEGLAVITESGAPSPGRSFASFRSGVDGKKLICTLGQMILQNDRKGLVFFNSRNRSKLMLHALHTELRRRKIGQLTTRTALYNRTVPAKQKEQIIARINGDGEPLNLLYGTSSLEVGLNLSGLDTVVVYGYPGTGAFRQRAGRCGREEEPGLVLFVPTVGMVDAWFAKHPEQLFGGLTETALLNPDYPTRLQNHLLAAAAESGIHPQELDLFGVHAEAVAGTLLSSGQLTVSPSGFLVADPAGNYHKAIAFRGTLERQVKLVDASNGSELEEIDFSTAIREVYPGAIYRFQGDSGNIVRYRVRSLDRESDTATLEPLLVSSTLTTEANSDLEIKLTEVFQERVLPCEHGELRLALQGGTVKQVISGYREYTNEPELHCLNRQCSNHKRKIVGIQSNCLLCHQPLELDKLSKRELSAHDFDEPLEECYETVLLSLQASDDLIAYLETQVNAIRDRYAETLSVPAALEPLFNFSAVEVALHSFTHALLKGLVVTSNFSESEVTEVTRSEAGSPVQSLYFDTEWGGTGACEYLFHNLERVAPQSNQIIKQCDCDHGCPYCFNSRRCVQGNEGLYRESVDWLLQLVLAPVTPVAAVDTSLVSDPPDPRDPA